MLDIQKLLPLNFADTVDLAVEAGTCLAVMGPSGGGKTLLLRAIADLDPNRGEVSLDGIQRSSLPAPDWRRRVTYVSAEPAWWADAVAAHFAEPEEAHGIVEALGLPTEAMRWPVERLSTGERQRLGLARALAQKPRCLLLDEPTSGLDEDNRDRVESMLAKHLAGSGIAVIVTHDAVQARRLGKSILLVEGGRGTVTVL